MISEIHQAHLPLKYGIDPTDERVQAVVSSVDKDEAQQLLHRNDVGSGLLIRYPENGAFTVRLDEPIPMGDKQAKYLRRKDEPNVLFNPGVNLNKAREIWITEGEMKSLAGFTKGLPVLGLSGVWNWRTDTEASELLPAGARLPDGDALLPELQRSWKGKLVVLIYDSDIVPGHRAYDAFSRLAEQLYKLGAEEVRIITLPSTLSDGKTGLDDFLVEKGGGGPQLLRKIVEKAEMYIPHRDGAEAFAERLISRRLPEDLLWAAGCLLVAKGEYLARSRLELIKGMKKKDVDAIIRDAKTRIVPELEAKPEPFAERLRTDKLDEDVLAARERISDSRYTIDDFGQIARVHVHNTVDGGTHTEIVPFTNFAAWPMREIVKDDGLVSERFIEMEGAKLGHRFPAITVPMATFGSMRWVAERWGARANIQPKMEETLRYVLMSMVDTSRPDDTIYTHLGWRKVDDSWIYLHAGGAVGSDYVGVEIASRLAGYVLPADDGVDVAEALETSLRLLKVGKEEITYPLLALVYLAPLCDALMRAGREPGFAAFMVGPTASFKSTTTALFLSHYGAFNAKGLPASFRDTAFSAEIMGFIAKDTLLVVDDLYPPHSPKEKAKLESALEYLTRSQGDRQGRGRLKKTRELMTGNPPRGLALCTGEEMNLGAGSSYYRLLLLRMEMGDIDEELLTEAQAEADVLPYVMKGYLEYLAPQLDDAPEHLRDDFDGFRAMATGLSTVGDKHRRLDEVVAHLAVGFMSLARFATARGVWTEEEAKAETEKAFNIFVRITDSQAAASSESDPMTRFFNGLQELLATGKIYFAGMDDEKSEDVPPTAEKVGWGPDDGGMIYLSLSSALEKVKHLYRGADEPLMATSNALLDLMEQREIISRNDKGERVLGKTIGGKTRRVLPILESNIYGGLEDE